MKTYDDKDIKHIDWTKFKIIVEREEDRQEILDAMEYFHNNGFDSKFITVNQLAHEYLKGTNTIVDAKLYQKLNGK